MKRILSNLNYLLIIALFSIPVISRASLIGDVICFSAATPSLVIDAPISDDNCPADTIQIELVALQLTSTAPIQIELGQVQYAVDSFFDIFVE